MDKDVIGYLYINWSGRILMYFRILLPQLIKNNW